MSDASHADEGHVPPTGATTAGGRAMRYHAPLRGGGRMDGTMTDLRALRVGRFPAGDGS
jgi:hypothetical protein